MRFLRDLDIKLFFPPTLGCIGFAEFTRFTGFDGIGFMGAFSILELFLRAMGIGEAIGAAIGEDIAEAIGEDIGAATGAGAFSAFVCEAIASLDQGAARLHATANF
jgi:hypothetical protein